MTSASAFASMIWTRMLAAGRLGALAAAPEQVEAHDRQEIRRQEQQQRGEHQRQAARLDLGLARHQLEAATRAAGLLPLRQARSAHQQIALVASQQLVQRQIAQRFGRGRNNRSGHRHHL